MSLNISITGIDGCGKSSTIAWVVNNLAQDYTIAKIGKPSYIQWINSTKEDLSYNRSNIIGDISIYAQKTQLRPIVALTNILYVINQNQLIKNTIVNYHPDMIIYDRDRIVDSLVYWSYYIPPTKHISLKLRTKAIELISWAKLPDLLVYMDIEPDLSIQRISLRSQEAEENMSIHENLHNLIELKKYYEDILSYLYWHTTVQIYTMKVDTMQLNDVIDTITTKILETHMQIAT